MSEVRAFIGLGSNLSRPVEQIRRAVECLAELSQTRLLAASPLYRSKPLGPQDQPDFINAVALVATTLAPHRLLDALQSIERAAGRVRNGGHWGPRTLDLDLLLYGDEVIIDERLTVPHPGLPSRGFVLYPLRDIAPGLNIPGHGLIEDLLANCPDVPQLLNDFA